ncbi:MAG: ribonuclease HI [Clostridia bacterium]|nr:ribonuclease HI [Clostridia bacterium]
MSAEREKKTVVLYTDGACTGNPGVGGWACILTYGKAEKRLSGADPATTNNRMEMTALIQGLKCLKESCNVNVFSDSSYIINAFNQGWLDSWIRHGFRKADGKPVLNVDLWQELYELSKHQNLNFNWVKGHADNHMNNECDHMAVQAYRDYIEAHKGQEDDTDIQYTRAPGGME